jgi:predicted phage terminase large subunit-like protein
MVSYTDDKAKIFTGRILLELLYNPRIREDFKYRFIRKEIGNIQISLEGFKASVKSFSIGQNVRGEIFYSYRPDKARLDDIQDRKKAKSRKFVESAIEWILLDLLPAMNPKNYSCIISATPLNKKCVVSALKEGTESRKPVLSYSYPAIRDGHSTWPSRFTLKYLEEIKGNIGSLFFNQEYLLIPMPVDETVFREEWIRYYSKEDLKNFKPVMILTWTDPSLTSKGCYKATVCLASDGVYDYVLKARVKKESVSSMLGGIYQIHRQYHPLILFYEDYTDDPKNQTILQEAIDTKEKEAGYSLPLKPERNTLNKEMRIEGTLSSRIENGLVRFDRDDPDQKIIIDELLSFPESEYLDGADALEGAVRKMREFCLKYRGKITTRKSRYPSRILEGY